ncbi:uncharacterized protein Os-C [Calliphora vicina]|uniref:uncharacterized protein Os-C n=1 Tax=Calliphora vicina TaxID=7373 RepID=UPI00325A467B
MAFHLKRTLILLATVMVIMQITKGQDEPPAESEEEDDSSSEETVEDSNEAGKRRRRSVETSVEGADVSAGEPNSAPALPGLPALPALPAIPGLPDAQTIMQIAEILTSVGQQVLPILVSGNSGVSGFVTNRAARDKKFLKNFKNEIDVFTHNMKKKK